MKTKIERREFIKVGGALAAASLLGGPITGDLLFSGEKNFPTFASVKSKDRVRAVKEAVELVGGIKRFVTRGSRVGLLINAPQWWKKKGSFVHPDIVLSVIKLCFDAGASEVQYLIDPPGDYFERSQYKDKFSDEIRMVKGCSGNFIGKEINGAVSLKKVDIIKEVFECDIFINIPIFKHHVGTHISCNLKNMMGLNTHSTNRFFHHGSGAKGGYDDVKFLSQCIADLNTLRKPDLCVMDATVFLGTGGPAGPGLIMAVNRIIAGTDPVAIDSYSSSFLNHKPGDITMIKLAGDQGLGKVKFEGMDYRETAI